jgi:hypothetical protein
MSLVERIGNTTRRLWHFGLLYRVVLELDASSLKGHTTSIFSVQFKNAQAENS